MRSLDRYVLALVITVFLGVSGGAAAGFAVGLGNDSTPPSDTVATDYRESTPLPGVAGDQSSDVGYSDMYQVGEQKVRTSPTASGNYPASSTTRMGENDVVASVVPPFSVSMGESAAAWVALSQRLFSVQWAGGLSATGLLMPLGDVNLDGLVGIEDLTMMTEAFGATKPDPPWLDLNLDGMVNILDLAIQARHFGESI